MTRTTSRGEKRLRAGRLATSIGGDFLSKHSSDFSGYKITGGGNSAPHKTFDSHNKRTRTSESSSSDAIQDVKDRPVCPGTEQDEKKRFHFEKSYFSSFSLNGSGSNAKRQ